MAVDESVTPAISMETVGGMANSHDDVACANRMETALRLSGAVNGVSSGKAGAAKMNGLVSELTKGCNGHLPESGENGRPLSNGREASHGSAVQDNEHLEKPLDRVAEADLARCEEEHHTPKTEALKPSERGISHHVFEASPACSDTAIKSSEVANAAPCEDGVSSDDDGVTYVEFKSELQMPDIMRLIQKDLSEPYSIYTYRYFIHNWPHLCFMVRMGPLLLFVMHFMTFILLGSCGRRMRGCYRL